MSKPEPSILLPIIHRFSVLEFGIEPDLEQDKGLVALIRETLWGRRELWAVAEQGLVTEDEAASALADRVCVWLAASYQVPMPTAVRPHWDTFLDDLRTALFDHREAAT